MNLMNKNENDTNCMNGWGEKVKSRQGVYAEEVHATTQ